MIIGLTGKNASGKGEVAQLLKEAGFSYLSLSDLLRESLQQRGLQLTRENLLQLGQELRQQYGGGHLADLALRRVDIDKNYIVDSVRNPREVEVLKRIPQFKLIHVTAVPEVRFQRMKLRAREGDPQTLAEFEALETRERASPDPSAQQLEATAKLADAELENNDSLEALRERSRALLGLLAQQMPRPSWDDYFMGIARMVALRSNCLKRKVAALIVREKRIVSTGYNGTPRGVQNCNEGGCPRCKNFGASGAGLEDCYCSHAEENAITQAAYHGVAIKGAALYTTFSPCLICTKMIINSGIREVIYNSEYPMAEASVALLREAQVRARKAASSGEVPANF